MSVEQVHLVAREMKRFMFSFAPRSSTQQHIIDNNEGPVHNHTQSTWEGKYFEVLYQI